MTADEKETEKHQPAMMVVHSLPILTSFRGFTDVEENFSRHITRNDGNELRNAFRGRVLIGREVILPPSYALVCASFAKQQEKQQAFGAAGQMMSAALSVAQVETASDDVHITGTTDRFCLWAHDKQPERPDALLNWLELSHAVHMEP